MKKLNWKYFYTVLYFPVYLISFFLIERWLPILQFHDITLSIDHQIPYIPGFIIFYYLWFPYVVYSVVRLFFINKEDYLKMITMLYIGMSLFILISIIYPNKLNIRPTIHTNSLFNHLVNLIYQVDTPTNVLPSIHVYNSFAMLLALHSSKMIHKYEKIITGILTIGIILSTIFVKQHGIVDISSAIALNIVMYIFVYKKHLYFYHQRFKQN